MYCNKGLTPKTASSSLKVLVSKSGVSFSRGLFSMANCFFRWRKCVSFPVEKVEVIDMIASSNFPSSIVRVMKRHQDRGGMEKGEHVQFFSQQLWDGVETQMILYMVWYIHIHTYMKYILTITWMIFDTSRLFLEGKRPKKSAAELHLGTPRYLFELKGLRMRSENKSQPLVEELELELVNSCKFKVK